MDGHSLPLPETSYSKMGLRLLVVWVSVVLACDISEPAVDIAPSTQRQQNVLVMDDGFDLSLPVFAGKIAGRYTMDCATTAVVTASDSRSSKDKLLATLAAGDHTCHLRSGISFERPVALERIAKYRSRWNQATQQGRSLLDEFTWSEAMEIQVAFTEAGGPDGNAFHGTSTAATIAYANPDVRLIIVQLSLTSQADGKNPFACPTQAEVDATVALLTERDVRRAYVERPRADIDQELDDLIRTTRVGLWNKSFGKPSRAATEAALFESGCGHIDLSQYMAAKGELDSEYEARWPVRDYLEVLAAGNDGSRVDGPRDQDGCHNQRSTSVVVGSYGTSYKLASFSNHGGCVDVFAPGEDVLVSLPDGWLIPMSGTSFSTPLVTRWASLRKGKSFTPETARTAILALRDIQYRVPQDQFPRELVNAPRENEVQRSAMMLGGRATPMSAAASRLVNDIKWRQALWPLTILQSRPVQK